MGRDGRWVFDWRVCGEHEGEETGDGGGGGCEGASEEFEPWGMCGRVFAGPDNCIPCSGQGDLDRQSWSDNRSYPVFRFPSCASTLTETCHRTAIHIAQRMTGAQFHLDERVPDSTIITCEGIGFVPSPPPAIQDRSTCTVNLPQ